MGRLPNGMSPDGLSYYAEADIPRQIGSALANYEAQSLNPRGLHESEASYQGRVANAPKILENELSALRLLASVMTGQKIDEPRSSAMQPKTFEIGNSLVQLDPATNKATPVYTAPAAPTKPESVPVVLENRLPVMGGDVTAKVTPDQLPQAFQMMSPEARTNALNVLAFQKYGIGPYSTNKAATATSPGQKRWVRDQSGRLVPAN